MKKLFTIMLIAAALAPAAYAIRYLSLDKYIIDGNVEYAKAVIEQGECAACDTSFGLPRIHAAVQAGPKMIQLLLDNGADINKRDFAGYTPLIRAVISKDVPLSTVEFLLKKEAKITIADNLGQNALMWTMHNSDVSKVKLLLEYIKEPAAFTQKDKKGDTALDSLLCYPPKDKKDKDEKAKLLTDAMREMGLKPINSCKHKNNLRKGKITGDKL